MNQKANNEIAIDEMKRLINIDQEYNNLSEYGIEVLKEAIAVLEGRIRISKLQFSKSS